MLTFIRNSITYRRTLLDHLLAEHRHLMQGLVVDVGGEKSRRRGTFRPKEDGSKWYYINISPENDPDVLGDAHRLPLRSSSVDCIVCCEVLEHISGLEHCWTEMARILKPGGTFIISIPFLYPVHADPYDYRRLTPEGLKELCTGCDEFVVIAMGRELGTLGMLIELAARELKGSFIREVLRRLLVWLGRALSYAELSYASHQMRLPSFTTGYFCTGRKV